MSRMNLDNWAIVTPFASPYTPPELLQDHLEGIPDHHPRLGGGRTIITSAIVKGVVENGEIIVTTKSGSVYVLKNVNAEYEQMHPNAKQRLIDRINVLNGQQ